MALAPADGALLDAVRTIRWPARRRAPAGLAGEHLARVRGASSEFTDYRGYRQGDDTRRIEWKLLARSNRAYIRLSEDSTVLPTMLLLDASASLAYPTNSIEKWHYARHIVLGLAAAAHRSRDPVGVIVSTEHGPQLIPARARAGTVHQIAELLAAITPSGSAPLAPALETLRWPGRIAVISDFLGDSDALLSGARALTAAGRDVFAIHVVHAHELEPPLRTGIVIDPEASDLKRTMTSATRQGYIAAFAEWREQTARAWRLAGAHYSEVVTTQGAAQAVRRITSGAARGGA